MEARAKALTRRPDFEDKVLLLFEQRREALLPVDFAWWRATFHKVFKTNNEPLPSDSKIHRAIKLADIIYQSVRDHMTKSVAERIDQVRTKLIRLDRVQRSPGINKRDSIYGRI